MSPPQGAHVRLKPAGRTMSGRAFRNSALVGEVTAMEVFPGISMDPDVRFGKPCIVGTRIDVATIAGSMAAGETIETVAAEYQLSLQQVKAALAYAAHVAAHL